MKIEETLKKLIKFESIKSKPDEIGKCMDFIKSEVDLSNVHIKEYESNGKRSLVAVVGEKHTLEPELIYHGHIDVVEGKAEQFDAYTKGDKLYGRGSEDMKAGIAIMIHLIKHYSSNYKKGMSIAFAFTDDEEIGGFDGAGYLFRKIGYKAKFFVTVEGEVEYYFKVKQKGILALKLTYDGKKAHGAYTWDGNSSTLGLIDNLNKLRGFFKPKPKRKDNWYSSFNVGIIKGGETVNTVPDYAEAHIDIRFTQRDWNSKEEIIETFKSVLDDNCSLEVLVEAPLMDTDEDNPYLKKLESSFYKVIPNHKGNLYFYNHATNDARYAAEQGIPSIGFGPVGGAAHEDGEWVSIKSINEYFQLTTDFIDSVYA